MRRSLFAIACVAVLAPRLVAQTPDEKAALATFQRIFDGMRAADSGMVRSGFAAGARFAGVDTRTTPATIRYDEVDGWLRGIAGSNKRWDEQIYNVQVR